MKHFLQIKETFQLKDKCCTKKSKLSKEKCEKGDLTSRGDIGHGYTGESETLFISAFSNTLVSKS